MALRRVRARPNHYSSVAKWLSGKVAKQALRRSTLMLSWVLGGVGLWLLPAASAEADIVRGVQEILSGVLQVPLSTLTGTLSGPPILGTLFGAINGLFRGVGLLAHGTLELASSGVAAAKAVGPYLLPFLL